MSIPYGAGVAAAVVAGIAFNLGMVIQKVAVTRLPAGKPLARSLLHSPLWFIGLLVQVVIGAPANLLAAIAVGPALLPGLLATGLVVLAAGSVLIARESPGVADVAGILFVAGATALLGLSRLAVDVVSYAVWKPSFLARLAAFSVVLLAVSGAGNLSRLRLPRLGGVLLALDAGLYFALSNQWLGVALGMGSSALRGDAPGAGILFAALAGAVALGATAFGTYQNQRAFQVGDASRVVPITQVPQQALPLVAFLAVFRLAPPSAAAIPLAATGIALMLAGAFLLARRQAAAR